MARTSLEHDFIINSALIKACRVKDWSRIESVIVSPYDQDNRFIQDVLLYRNDTPKIAQRWPDNSYEEVESSGYKTAITVNYIC